MLSTCLCASVLNLDPLGIVFFFLNTLRTLGAEHGITSKDRRADSTHFSYAGAQANFHRAPWLKTTARGRNPRATKGPARPVDGLQTAARRVRLVRPARDRRARPDRGPLPKLRALACELCRDPGSRTRARRRRTFSGTRRAHTREPRPVRPLRVLLPSSGRAFIRIPTGRNLMRRRLSQQLTATRVFFIDIENIKIIYRRPKRHTMLRERIFYNQQKATLSKVHTMRYAGWARNFGRNICLFCSRVREQRYLP